VLLSRRQVALDFHGVMQQAHDFNCTGLLAGLLEVLLQVLAAEPC